MDIVPTNPDRVIIPEDDEICVECHSRVLRMIENQRSKLHSTETEVISDIDSIVRSRKFIEDLERLIPEEEK